MTKTTLFFSILTGALALQSSVAQEYDPRTNPRPPVRPMDMNGFHLGFPDAYVIPMLSAEDTNGEFEAWVEHIQEDYYGPPHVHYEKSETIVVTDGIIHMRVAGKDYTLTEGQWLHIPAGNVHGFRSTAVTARFIAFQTPGNAPVPPPDTEECDRSKFTPEMNSDPEIINRWYHDCAHDFYMVPEEGLPFE